MANRLKIAVLLSGGGSSLLNLVKWREAGRLNADIGLVISSRPDVKGLRIAADAGIKSEVIDARDFNNLSAREGEKMVDWVRMSAAMNHFLLRGSFDLVCMAGFLSRYVIPDALYGKVLNIHPSLIPMFCGQGMYGAHVHKAVLASGVRVTGCTVHFANNEYDAGPIILQRACPVYSGDTTIDVASRVFQEECRAYPTAINLIAEGRVVLDKHNRVHVEHDNEIGRFGI